MNPVGLVTKKDNARFYQTVKNHFLDAGKDFLHSGGIETLPDGKHLLRGHPTARNAGFEMG